MCWGLLLAVLAAAPAAVPPAPAPAAAPDPELQVLATSLAPSQRAAVEKALEKAVGGLGALPRYRVDVELDVDTRVLKAREQIAWRLPERMTELWLRIPANAPHLQREAPDGPLKAVVVDRVICDGKEVLLGSQENGVYRVVFPEPREGEVLLELELHSEVPELQGVSTDATSGMASQAMTLLMGGGEQGKTDYGAFGWSGGTFNLGGVFPELTRREAGVFDISPEAGVGEPRWGALGNWVVSVVAPPGLQVAGTGVEVGQTPEKDGRRRTTRVAAAVRGFGLVAGVGYEEQKATAGEVKLRVLAPVGHALQAKKMLYTAAGALKHYAEHVGPYPWASLELVEAPLTDSMEAISFPTFVMASGLLGSMGHVPPQLTGGADPAAMVDPVLELVIAHQVAHQWWRGVVGSDGRGRPVLDEPVAAYAAILYVTKRRGAAHAEKQVEEQLRQPFRLLRTLGHPDAAADRPISEYSGRLEFEAILKGKGGLFHHKLRQLLGDKTYFAALKASVAHNAFKEVDSDPVLLAAASLAPNKAQAALKLYDRWTRQTKGDQDIGAQLDFGAALAGQGMQIDPASMKLLQQMMQQLGGVMGGGGQPPPAPPPGQKSKTGP